jgi:transcriptional regulator CtsR
VITSRFTPERGYIVESKRGGGGFIRIKRVEIKAENLIMHIVNCIGASIDEASCKAIMSNLCNNNIINSKEEEIIIAAISNNTLRNIDNDIRDKVRASIFKNILLCL